MPQQNIKTLILRTFECMPQTIFNYRFFIALLLAALLLLGGCKKAIENISEDTLQRYFEQNILNKDFVVQLATDNGVDNTSQYNGYTFVLAKGSTYFDGPMTGTKDGTIYTGTWSSNEDYSKLTISITTPAVPSSFEFLNRPWRFTKKSLPIMELAPWGTTDPKVLHMKRL
ncbi:MAG: hypothetical protein RL172_2100 [Bacteroidota bacterium]|jgi:hypothetical protein